MAACGNESELLNDTLAGLRSTSKGQLRYDTDWQLNAQFSSQFSCSFQSFLNESSDSLLDVNTSLSFLAGSSDENSSGDENEEESSLVMDGTSEKTSSSLGIAVNFDTENERSIRQYYESHRGNVEERKAKRARIFELRRQNLRTDAEQELKSIEENLAEETRQFESEITELEQQDKKDLQKIKKQLDEKATAYKKKLDQIIIRSLTEESLAARERERRIAVENSRKIISLYQEVLQNIEIIKQKFADFKYMSFVDAQHYDKVTAFLDNVQLKAENTISAYKASTDLSAVEDNFVVMKKLIEATLSIDGKVENIFKLAHEKAREAARKREAQLIKLEQAKQEQQKILEAQLIKLEQEKQEQQKKVESIKKLSEKLPEAKNEEKLPTVAHQTSTKESTKTTQQFTEFISDKALVDYAELQEHLNKVQASYGDFISDPKQTKYKFDLQKAVNIPINALSAQSPSHLNDKIRRLVLLLSGSDVESGAKRVNCKAHPSAMIFCKDLVAKKLVMQGAQQVSSNPESAFLYAAVIVGIWSAFPDVGKIILAHFHRSFPYLVPYYMPQVEGQSNNDYHKALGYSVNNDKIQDENHFLKKFSGTVQLYAAVVSSKGATTPDHPHGIDKGWTWLARTLNLKPHPSVTATMLFEFIKVAGHLLMEKYRKQFQKLLLMLFKDFIPAIDKVTPAEKQGPTERFKDFLDECVKTQRIAVPKGYLTDRWWQSGHF